MAGAAVGAVLLFYLYSGNGGGSNVSSAVATTDPNADALAAAQLSAQTTIAGYSAAATHDATVAQSQLDIAKLAYGSSDFQNTLAAEVALSNIGASADVAKNSNAMNQTIALGAQQAQTQLASIQSNTTIQNTALLTGALVQQADINSRTQIGVAQQQVAAVAAGQQHCTSFLGIFSSC